MHALCRMAGTVEAVQLSFDVSMCGCITDLFLLSIPDFVELFLNYFIPDYGC